MGVRKAERRIFNCLTMAFNCDIGVGFQVARHIYFCLTVRLIFLEKVWLLTLHAHPQLAWNKQELI